MNIYDFLNKNLYRIPLESEGSLILPKGNSVFSENLISGEVDGTITFTGGFIQSKGFVTGSSGWRLTASGDLEANSGTFRGDLVAGSIDIPDTTTANSFHVDSNGNAWWGATTLASSLAKVTKAGKATFQGMTVLSTRAYTIFETSGRFTQTVTGTGTVTFNDTGMALLTGATQNSLAYNRWETSSFDVFAANPTVSILLTVSGIASDANPRWVGLGNCDTTDFTVHHAGFKILSGNLYATQAGGTETVSSALTAVVSGDTLDLIIKMNDSSIDYYYRLNLGAFSAVTTLTTNMPTATSSFITFAAKNSASTNSKGMVVRAASYER